MLLKSIALGTLLGTGIPGQVQAQCNNDVTPPTVLTCPANITVFTGPAATGCTRTVSWTPPTATDNCDPQLTVSTNYSPGDTFNIGVTTVLYVFTDNNNNKDTCSFTVTVVDNTPPVFGPVNNIVVNRDPGKCGAIVNYTQPTFTDNCPNCVPVMPDDPIVNLGFVYIGTLNGHSYYLSPSSADWNNFDAYAKSLGGYMVAIGSGLEDTFLRQRITGPAWIGFTDQVSEGTWVWANGEPVGYTGWCSGQPDNTNNADYGVINGGAGGCWTDDNSCCLPSIFEYDCSFYAERIVGGTSGSEFPVGTSVVQWMATDASGNKDTVSFTVTVRGAVKVTCPPNVTVACDGNTNPSGTGTATAVDTCISGTPVITYVDSSTQVASLTDCRHYNYSIYRKWIATLAGSSDTCTQVITVRDIVAPTAKCKNISVTLGANGTATITAASVNDGSFDNCSPVILSNVSPATFTCANAGQNVPVTLTVQDVCGNTSTCTATVAVTGPSLTISCPANATVSCQNSTAPSATGTATGTACGGAPQISFSDASTKGNDPANCSFYNYTITRTWTATAGGNSVSCNQTITVNDLTPPTAICKNNMSVQLDANGNASITPAQVNNGSTDNCSPVTLVSVTPSSFTCANAGQNTVTLTVRDACGNTSTCTSTVTVTGGTAFAINCPSNKTVSCEASTAPSATGTATATGCGSTPAVTFSDASTKASSPSACGHYNYVITRTWTATQGSNTKSCVQTITVKDETKPVAKCKNITVYLGSNGSVSITPADVNDGSTDNCSPVTLVSVTPSTFTCANIGQNCAVTLKVKDACGNESTCTSTVTVKDNTPPVISCPANVTRSCQVSCTPVYTGHATATDNCCSPVITHTDVSTKSSNPASCSYYSYTITRTWKATDANGNSSTCNQIITVKDDTDPVAKCKNKSVTLVNGVATITPADINNGSYDNCSPVTLVSVTPSTFDCSDIGSNKVTLKVRDACGNESTCQSYVTVNGNKCNCSITVTPSNSIYTGGIKTNIYLGYGPQKATLTVNATGGSGFTYLWSGPHVSKLSCTTCKSPVFTPTQAGNYTFTVTVKNSSGCTSTCSITFCVTDVRVPDHNYDDDDDDHYSHNDDDDDNKYNKYNRDNCDDDDDNYNKTSYSSNNPAKVYLCHVPPGNPSNAHTIHISINAVAAHLSNHSGDRLGKCSKICGSNARFVSGPEKIVSRKVKVYPNPTNGSFVVELPYFEDKAQITITDVQGRIIQRKEVTENDGFKFGFELGAIARGVYMVDVVYNDQRVRTKLVVQ